jgi:SNF2 family DNA or RNA helicase
MQPLQASWCEGEGLFFWSSTGSVDATIDQDLPELRPLLKAPEELSVALPGAGGRRRKTKGYRVPLSAVLPLLPALRNDAGLSDSLRCWSMAARLGLELASRQAVVPTVRNGEARWRALWSRRIDRHRLDAIVESLPVAARSVPTRDRGPVRLQPAEQVIRDFIDAIADSLYRRGAYPGPTRGWALDFAEALRGDEPTFQPRDARYYGVPEKLASWAASDGAAGLQLAVQLHLPERDASVFPLTFWMCASDEPDVRLPVSEVWSAGEQVQFGERAFRHPAYATIAAFARAKRVFPPLAKALVGAVPVDLGLDVREAWDFLANGAPSLQDSGFDIRLPEAFSREGSRRIRARMRIEAGADLETLRLDDMLTYRWEVTLGGLVLSGADFAEITQSGQPIVRFRGEWVLLDPAELEKLPAGLTKEGRLNAADALRAVLTGQHDGVPVVADARLDMVIDALRQPPELAPPAGLQATLRPYQVSGFSWLSCLGDLGLGSCLADDMGLGKTIQVIAHLLQRKSRGPKRPPSLVVCPTSVLGNWQHEIQRFAPSLTVSRHHGLFRDLHRARRSDIVLTTYGLLGRDADELAEHQWDVVALDEAQSIKNPDSQRAKAALRLKARHRVAMSGTPVENRLEELWSLMHFLMPGLLGGRRAFKHNVAIPVERFGDEEVARRLQLGVSPFLLRRVKTDPTIIDDLPDKIERHEYCTLTAEQARLYRQVSEEFLERIAEVEAIERRGQVLAMLTALKQICNHPDQYLKETGTLHGRSGKLERARELVEAVVEADERMIIFTQYREMGDRLVRYFRERLSIEAPFLHGGVSTDNRDEMVRQFQEDEDGPAVLVVSLRAGGTGLNLTRATHVLHYDRWWNPAVEDQATDRAYRIGQRRNVQVYKFVCQSTYEERIDAMLEEKRALANSVVGSGERLVTELDDDALRALVALGEDAVMEDE